MIENGLILAPVVMAVVAMIRKELPQIEGKFVWLLSAVVAIVLSLAYSHEAVQDLDKAAIMQALGVAIVACASAIGIDTQLIRRVASGGK